MVWDRRDDGTDNGGCMMFYFTMVWDRRDGGNDMGGWMMLYFVKVWDRHDDGTDNDGWMMFYLAMFCDRCSSLKHTRRRSRAMRTSAPGAPCHGILPASVTSTTRERKLFVGRVNVLPPSIECHCETIVLY